MKQTKQTYSTPSLKEWGNVATLTQNGCTQPGGDSMGGSVTWSQGNPTKQCEF